ncbi:hypothetical protein ACFL2Z_05585, partial [Candidatus Eisenbacteria bacterium]
EPGSEYEEVRRSIKKDLLATRDHRTGEPMFKDVYMREEIYEGPYLEEAPDMVFLPRDMRNKALGTLDFTSNKFEFPVYGNSGDHRMDGIFLGLGPAFRKGVRLEPLSVLDVAPTVLHLLGLPVPKQMDGKVAAGALDGDYMAQNPVRETDMELLGRARGSALSSGDSDDIRKRLEGIGYIG